VFSHRLCFGIARSGQAIFAKPVKSLIALIIGKNLDAGELVQVDER